MPKPRVFVSSVMEDFQGFRQAAKQGIIAAGGEPVLVEDYPSLSASPRTACLDGVASCDALVILVGERGGWTTPSGKVVVEEEYEEAVRLKLPVFAFIQALDHRDEQAHALATRLSDYVNGHFRTIFNTAQDLRNAVERALAPIMEHKVSPVVDISKLDKLLVSAPEMGAEVVLRFVLMPERSETFIDEVEIASEELHERLLALAHSRPVQLFSYTYGREIYEGIDQVRVQQIGQKNRREARDDAQVTVTSQGVLIVDTNVTGREPYNAQAPNVIHQMHYILEADVRARLQACFAFAHGLFELRDPGKRHDRFFYNVSLSKVGPRVFGNQIPNTNSLTYPQSIDSPIVALQKHTLISRNELANPNKQIDAVLSLLARRIPARDSFGMPRQDDGGRWR